MDEPLTPAAAKDRILACLGADGRMDFSSHARKEMADDGISLDEARRVLRGGVVEPAEFEGGSYRYRVRAGLVYVVVAFQAETWTIVVTAWRKKKR